jgi:replicative DNA helicase
MKEVNAIYELQGINIARKHIELIVRQMFSRRKIKETGDTPFTAGEIVEYEELVKKESRRIKSVKSSNSGINSTFLSGMGLRELASANYDEINDESCVLKIGIPEMDRLFNGLKNGTATLAAAPTCNFKSGWLMNLALGVCKNNNGVLLKDKTKKPFVQYISHENKPTLTLRRMIKYILNISEKEAKKIPSDRIAELIEKETENWEIKIKIDYVRAYTMEAEKISSLINGVVDEDGTEMECVAIFHDYLFLLKAENIDFRLALSKNMRTLADIAIEEAIPVITLSQLNGEAELLKHLTIRTVGESKAILQHCDDVFLFRLQSYIPTIPPTNPLIPPDTTKFKYLEVYHVKSRSSEDHDQSRIIIPFSLTNSFRLAEDPNDSLFRIVSKEDLGRELDEKYEVSKSNSKVQVINKAPGKAVNIDMVSSKVIDDDDGYG